MLRVGINGFGTIGKRVADAVRAQPDMTVAGVAKRTPNYEAEVARDRGYPLYAAGAGGADPFQEAYVPVAGTVVDLLAESDVVVDATPSGVGAENAPLYADHDTPAVFQGGEGADVADASFNARANYDEAVGADSVRVVSCNTTGLSRVIAPLDERYGVERVQATLVRRGGDPDQTGRGPINDTLPDPVTIPTHHGPDVRTVFPDLSITTMGMKVPSTLMHVHALTLTLADDPASREVRDHLARESRLVVLPKHLAIDGAGKIRDYTSDAGRPRGDVWENCIWGQSVTVEPRGDDRVDCHLFQAIHQEADVVPENIDAVRALSERTASAEKSIRRTDEALGVGRGLVEHDGSPQRVDSHADD
jgi:glyceraldehyde-3-phosphate dehydrogenase (NAD(P))